MLSLISNQSVHYTSPDRVYCRDCKDLWIIRDVQVFNIYCSLVTMERVSFDFAPTGEIKEFSGDMFMEGSGYGGQRYFLDTNYHFRDGVFYCDWKP